MKTAEEWVKIYQDTFNQPDKITIHDVSEFERDKRIFIGVIEKIQFNARKQGLEDAYKVCNRVIGDSTTTLAVRYQIHQLIDNLK